MWKTKHTFTHDYMLISLTAQTDGRCVYACMRVLGSFVSASRLYDRDDCTHSFLDYSLTQSKYTNYTSFDQG